MSGASFTRRRPTKGITHFPGEEPNRHVVISLKQPRHQPHRRMSAPPIPVVIRFRRPDTHDNPRRGRIRRSSFERPAHRGRPVSLRRTKVPPWRRYGACTNQGYYGFSGADRRIGRDMVKSPSITRKSRRSRSMPQTPSVRAFGGKREARLASTSKPDAGPRAPASGRWGRIRSPGRYAASTAGTPASPWMSACFRSRPRRANTLVGGKYEGAPEM